MRHDEWLISMIGTEWIVFAIIVLVVLFVLIYRGKGQSDGQPMESQISRHEETLSQPAKPNAAKPPEASSPADKPKA
jgi:uncharacterized membrane protein